MDKSGIFMYNSEKVVTNMLYLSTQQRREISLCNLNYSPEGQVHPDRVMEEYDLLYLLDGSWDIVEDEVSYHVEKGQLLILEPHRHHCGREKCTPHMRNMFLHCSPLTGDGFPSPGALRLQKLTDCKSLLRVPELMQAIIETYWSAGDHAGFKLSALLDLLLAELSLPQTEESPGADPLTRDILRQFYANPHRFFSPDALAKEYGYSVRTLSGTFKRATGYSIHQYQLRLKLNMAHEQLPTSPGRSLRDVALSFGFYDEFQFSKLFKRQFGYPPSVRRRGLV